MSDLLGLPLELAEEILKQKGESYSVQEYPARFKDPVGLDSTRVVQIREGNRLVVSQFQTASQSR